MIEKCGNLVDVHWHGKLERHKLKSKQKPQVSSFSQASEKSFLAALSLSKRIG